MRVRAAGPPCAAGLPTSRAAYHPDALTSEECPWTPPSLIGTVLGTGKDALAQRYVSLATQSRAPALDLHALFRGAEGNPGGAHRS